MLHLRGHGGSFSAVVERRDVKRISSSSSSSSSSTVFFLSLASVIARAHRRRRRRRRDERRAPLRAPRDGPEGALDRLEDPVRVRDPQLRRQGRGSRGGRRRRGASLLLQLLLPPPPLPVASLPRRGRGRLRRGPGGVPNLEGVQVGPPPRQRHAPGPSERGHLALDRPQRRPRSRDLDHRAGPGPRGPRPRRELTAGERCPGGVPGAQAGVDEALHVGREPPPEALGQHRWRSRRRGRKRRRRVVCMCRLLCFLFSSFFSSDEAEGAQGLRGLFDAASAGARAAEDVAQEVPRSSGEARLELIKGGGGSGGARCCYCC